MDTNVTLPFTVPSYNNIAFVRITTLTTQHLRKYNYSQVLKAICLDLLKSEPLCLRHNEEYKTERCHCYHPKHIEQDSCSKQFLYAKVTNIFVITELQEGNLSAKSTSRKFKLPSMERMQMSPEHLPQSSRALLCLVLALLGAAGIFPRSLANRLDQRITARSVCEVRSRIC